MATYTVHLRTVAYATVEVEAAADADPDQITELALSGPLPELDAVNSGMGQTWSLTLEADSWREVVGTDDEPVIEARYDAPQIRAAHASRPGSGAPTDLKES